MSAWLSWLTEVLWWAACDVQYVLLGVVLGCVDVAAR